MSRGWANEAGVRPHINLNHYDADNRRELKSRVRRWMRDEGRKARRTMDDDLITVRARLNELCGEVSDEDVLKLTATNPERRKQIAFDAYYLNLGKAVKSGADCLGSHVGAVVVLKNRVVSTGYNGTPAAFTNCSEKGCVRCYDSWLSKTGRAEEMSDSEHTSGKSLDRCICVHAEQNAFLTAARFGIALEGATLYSTQSPCFGCLKEAVQIGIGRIVYTHWYQAKYSPKLDELYSDLCQFLAAGDPTSFECVGGTQPKVETEGQPDPYETDQDEAEPLQPPGLAANWTTSVTHRPEPQPHSET
jgi:dCMP deaminase